MFDRFFSNDKNSWQPNLDRVVPKYLVHKSFVSEVFLSDAYKDSDDVFLLSAVFPRTHSYYNDSSQKIDTSLLLEIFRQCSIYISRTFYSVPLDFKFIFDSAKFKLLNIHFTHNISQHVIIVVKVVESKRKKEKLNGLILEMGMYHNAQLCAMKTMDISFFQPKLWKKLRHTAQHTELRKTDAVRISKEMVVKKLDSNVVISDMVYSLDLFCSTIIPNMEHPAFFDHPLDHIPASLIFEALRQHALLVAFKLNIPIHYLLLAEINAEFKSFCEFFHINQCRSKRENIKVTNDEFVIDIEVVANDNICVLSQ